jgi:hypothetical protein
MATTKRKRDAVENDSDDDSSSESVAVAAPSSKKARMEHEIYAITQLDNANTGDLEKTVVIFSCSNRFVIEKVFECLKSATVLNRPGLLTVLVGGLSIAPRYWDLEQYASWHGITAPVELAYLASTLRLIQEMTRVCTDFDCSADQPLSNLTIGSGKLVFDSCKRFIPPQQ